MMLQPFINLEFQGQIWKFIIDDNMDRLFVETRRTEGREVTFSSIDLNNGITNFKDLVLPEKWLTGIAGSFRGTLFLHGYQSAQSPAHKGITAIDGKTCVTLWADYNNAIHHISINGPIVYNTQVQPKKLFLADAVTGSILRPYDKLIDSDQVPEIGIPDIINYIPKEFNLCEGQLTGNVHYFEHNSFRIVSLHLLNNSLLKQVLMISNGTEVVYDDLLNEGIQKLQPESFIVYQNRLIYIKNTTGLKVLNL